MTLPTRRARFALPALVALMAIGSQHAAPGDPVVSQEPMFVQGTVKPAFIMAVDDSGSMNLETLFETRDGALFWGGNDSFYNGAANWDNVGTEFNRLFAYNDSPRRREAFVPPLDNFGMARSHQFNPGYFNPATDYLPWQKAQAPHWPDALPTAAQSEPRSFANSRTSPVLNLTANMRDILPASTEPSDANPAEPFDFRSGMVLPVNTTYRNVNCSTGKFGTGAWRTATAAVTLANRTVDSTCTMYVEYYPATYFLTTATSPDGNTAGTLIASAPGGKNNLYKYEIKSGNYPAGTAYANAIQNFANWFQYYRNRRLATVGAMTFALSDQTGLRVGYFEINDYATATPAMQDVNDPIERALLYASITSLSYPPVDAQGTPNRQAVARIGQQFDTRTGATAPIISACQVNAGMLFTDGYSNAGGSALSNDSGRGPPFADNFSNTMADIASHYYEGTLRATGFPLNRVTPQAGCPNSKLDCRDDLHMNFYGITLGALANLYGNAPYIDNPLTPNVDEAFDAAYATPPAWSGAGSDDPDAVDEIWHASINGRGKFINAANPEAITNAMRNVLGTITASPVISGTRGATGARISDGSNSFTIEPLFNALGTDWTGDIVAKAVRRNGALVATPLWSAATKLDARTFSSRNILFAKAPGASATIDKRAFNGTNVSFADLGFGTTAGAIAARIAKYPGATTDWMADYLSGDRSREQTAGSFRKRSSRLGDIVNSPPLIASPKDNFGYYTRFDATGQTYAAYLTAKRTRKPVVYVGANDGMLHAFDATTLQCPGVFPDPSACVDPSSGNELFAFVPHGVLGKMNKLLDPTYGKGLPHAYFVDGESNVVDVKDGANWKTILVGTTGAGGRSVFALDVSDPASVGTANVLWELNSATAPVSGLGNFGDIGNTVGRPLILPLNEGTTAAPSTVWAAIFSNGYGGDSRKPALYVVNIMTGALIRKIEPNDGETGVYNGLGEITAIDTNGDGHSDTIYGGDLRGNVWKFNLYGPRATWAVSFGGAPLFTASVGTARQPITGGFRISAGPSGGVTVMFGTGSFVFESDRVVPASPAVQSLYAVWDKKDTDTVGVGGRSNLVGQTIISDNGTFRGISQNPVNYTIKFGWYLDLAFPAATPAGERFVGVPRIQNGKVFFATYTPNAVDECSGGGKNFLYILDLLSGQGAMAGLGQLGVTGLACTGSGCGAVALEPPGQKNVSPVMNTSVMVPPTTPVPGLSCIPGTPGCPATPTFQQCQVVIYPGAWVLRRPCDRQSWRQIR